MKLQDYKTVLYRQQDGSWVAEIPAIAGCYALMETALAELSNVFGAIAEEYREIRTAAHRLRFFLLSPCAGHCASGLGRLPMTMIFMPLASLL